MYSNGITHIPLWSSSVLKCRLENQFKIYNQNNLIDKIKLVFSLYPKITITVYLDTDNCNSDITRHFVIVVVVDDLAILFTFLVDILILLL
jgi:hypothetical protein